jgi:uncharacterized protein YndB with AHSA1/START domain
MTNRDDDAARLDYALSRELDAPVEKVWTAWTRPEHYAPWFGAPLPTIAMDVRPGGRWQAALVAPDGSEYPLSGSYRDVVENERLEVEMDVPGAAPAVMLIELTDLGGRTRIVLSQSCRSAEERAQSEQGSRMLLDGLAAYTPTI